MGICASLCGGDDGGNKHYDMAGVKRDDRSGEYVPPAAMHETMESVVEREAGLETLPTCNLRAWVAAPPGDDLEAWIARSLHDCFRDISLLCEMSMEGWRAHGGAAGEGFPDGFEYRWVNGDRHLEPMRVSAVEYVVLVMAWAEAQTQSLLRSSAEEAATRKKKLRPQLKLVFKRLFRVLAILAHTLRPYFVALRAQRHLNTVLKHFLYCCFEFQLVNEREFDALRGPVDFFKQQYGSLFDSVNRTLFDKTTFPSQVPGHGIGVITGTLGRNPPPRRDPGKAYVRKQKVHVPLDEI